MRRAWALVVLAGCGTPQDASPEPAPRVVPPRVRHEHAITATAMREVVQVLASDGFEGRGTGTDGGRRTTAWIAARMDALGLEPAGDGSSFQQAVPLRGFETRVASLTLGNTAVAADRFVVRSELTAGNHAGRWPIVRAGYGIEAPEFGRDDYAGLEVKEAVVLVRAGEPTEGFDGEALTRHGRWTTKLQRAREHGAVGCLIIHDATGAGYPWSVVQSSFGGERFMLADETGPPLSAWGWLADDPANAASLALELDQTTRSLQEHNVIGAVGSGKPPLVVVTAHWDHLGTGPEGVFNGAMDNASGVAAMLALAAAVKQRHDASPLAGTVLFAATAAEEVGLLGSTRLAASLDPASVVAAINFDGMNVGPVTPTVELVAAGLSSMDDLFREALRIQGRRALDDQSPQNGAAFRSDHAPFASRGVPVLYPQPGFTEVEDLSWARERARRYHTTEDTYDPRWSFEGAVADVRAVYGVVIDLADGEVRPRSR